MYPRLFLITFFIVFLIIRSYCYNILNIDNIEITDYPKMKYQNIMRKIPEINFIVEYFNYKLYFTCKYNFLLHTNNKYDVFLQMIKIKAIKEEFSDNGEASYSTS